MPVPARSAPPQNDHIIKYLGPDGSANPVKATQGYLYLRLSFQLTNFHDTSSSHTDSRLGVHENAALTETECNLYNMFYFRIERELEIRACQRVQLF